MIRILPLLVALFLASPAPAQDTATRLSLAAEAEAVVPGGTLWLAVRYGMEPGWHIYWTNPGDSGMPPTLEWKLPEGFEVGEAQWPVPERLVEEGLVTLGYEEEAIVLVPLRVPSGLSPGGTVTVRVSSEWLECKEMCVPGSGGAELTLPVAATVPAAAESPWFARARAALPGGPLKAVRIGNDLQVELPGESPEAAVWSYFPLEEGAWMLEPPPEILREEGRLRIRLTPNPAGPSAPEHLSGVLADETGRGFRIESAAAPTASPENAPAGGLPAPAIPSSDRAGGPGIILIALLAGVLLNLMPCIFPVLGLKISSFVEQAQGDRASVGRHAWVFSLGILLSMWALGAMVVGMGSLWGAQFQDPRVVIGLLLVLTLFTLNLFGVFEMGHVLTTVGGGLSQRQGYAGSFFQGILLTVIGTPCTGPVMVGVIGATLTQPGWVVALSFTAMGAGLALPYLLLAYSPKLLDRLPPPGMWMVTFKQGSAFLMVAFLWALLYVLHHQRAGAMPAVIGALFLICLAAWVLGTWGAPERGPAARRAARAVFLLLLVGATALAYAHHEPSEVLDEALEARIDTGAPLRFGEVAPALAAELLDRGVPLHYRPFTSALLAQLRAEGRPVFVDFTADWCTQCKVNKLRTLHREETLRAFQEAGVSTLRADLTRPDPALNALLAEHDLRGLPAYFLYVPGTERPELLPVQITLAHIREALSRIKGP